MINPKQVGVQRQHKRAYNWNITMAHRCKQSKTWVRAISSRNGHPKTTQLVVETVETLVLSSPTEETHLMKPPKAAVPATYQPAPCDDFNDAE